jgi:hypothetical protein
MGSPTFTSTRNYGRAVASVVSALTRIPRYSSAPRITSATAPAGVELDAIILVELDVEHHADQLEHPATLLAI